MAPLQLGSKTSRAAPTPPRITYLLVENYRALRRIELRNITPLTILVGPNGSGKSTLIDVFSFLAECFQHGLRHAWDQRGRGKELKTRGQAGPVVIELKYRERTDLPLITYHLAIQEGDRGPYVYEEWLRWTRGSAGRPFKFLENRAGNAWAVGGESPEPKGKREIPLRSPDLIAVNALGQLADHPRVATLREFISEWYVSYLSVDVARNPSESGPQERLSKSGDNLANVVQHLADQHPEQAEKIFSVLRRRIPRLETVMAEPMPDGRLLLKIKDAPFERPVPARFASDGTLKMLAYLIILYDPTPPRFIGIEEPENFLHPRLLPELAEECRSATARTQLLVTTHSPYFLNSARPEDVRVLFRDERGFAQVRQASLIKGVREFVSNGSLLGDLWMEGLLGVGDPLVNSGEPSTPRSA